MRKTIVSNRSSYILGIIVISLIGIILVAPLTFYDNEGIYLNNKNYEYNDFNLKSASNGLKPLNYSSIYQNTTLPLNRLFESIYFRVNISGFPDVDDTIMQISYQNGMFKNFSMSVLNEDEFASLPNSTEVSVVVPALKNEVPLIAISPTISNCLFPLSQVKFEEPLKAPALLN